MTVLKKRKSIPVCLLLALLAAVPVGAQTVSGAGDDSTLKQIVVFGRHSVRAPTSTPEELAQYASRPYPDFDNLTAGYLTPHGRKAAELLGSYFRSYLLHERLLTGNDRFDLVHSYFRANSIQRSNVTAARFGAGLIPGVTIPVHSFALGVTDPVFDPVYAGIVSVDAVRAAAEAQGIFKNGAVLSKAYSGERALVRRVLFDYAPGTEPPPPAPTGKVDVTAEEFLLSATGSLPATGLVVNVGGLSTIVTATDPFVMEYANGLPMLEVGWGQLSAEEISQQTRFVTLEFEIGLRAPYLARRQSSNAASHVLRTMRQAVLGEEIPGAFGDARSRSVVVVSSDGYVAGLAGLLRLHWALSGYQPDFCAPGGALVFELRQSRGSGAHFVRAFYTAQTFQQLRHLTPLTLEDPPATMQLLIPVDAESAASLESPYGAPASEAANPVVDGRPGASLDVPFDVFQKYVRKLIDPRCVQDPSKEVRPGVLTNVPLS